jgi:tetratricopeptide (TPR) repeat protein
MDIAAMMCKDMNLVPRTIIAISKISTGSIRIRRPPQLRPMARATAWCTATIRLVALYSQERYGEAIEAFDEAIKIDPQ